MLKNLLFFLVAFLSFSAQLLADSRISNAHPQGTIMISKGVPEEIRTVVVAGGAPTVASLMPKWFEQFGPNLPSVASFEIGSIGTALARKDNALIVHAKETALAVLDPLFDEPSLRFYALQNQLFLEAASVALSNGNVFGNGAQLKTTSSSQMVIMSNGPAEDRFDTLLYPSNVPLAQIQKLFSQLGITVGAMRPLTQENLMTTITTNFAVLISADALGRDAVASLASVIMAPHFYSVKQSTRFVDVTPPLRPTAQRRLKAHAQARTIQATPVNLSGVAIETLEIGLRIYGTFKEKPDGVFTDTTQDALNAWADRNGIVPGDEPTQEMMSTLFDIRSIRPQEPGAPPAPANLERTDFIVLHGVNLGVKELRSHFNDPALGPLNFNRCMAACAAEPLCKVVGFNHGCDLGSGISYRNDWGTTGFAADTPAMSSTRNMYSAVILRSGTIAVAIETDAITAILQNYVATDTPLPHFAGISALGIAPAKVKLNISGFQRLRKPAELVKRHQSGFHTTATRTNGAEASYGALDWIVVSPAHRRAVDAWSEVDDARRKDSAPIQSQLEKALQGIQKQFGPNDPRLVPILIDLAYFSNDSRFEFGEDWEANRARRIAYLRQAVRLVADVAPIGSALQRTTWNELAALALIASITPDTWDYAAQVKMEARLQSGRCFESKNDNLARSDQLIRIAAAQFTLVGAQPAQLGWLKAAAVCLENPDRALTVLEVRAGLALATGLPETLTFALGDLALLAFNQSNPELAATYLRQAVAVHSTLPNGSKPAFWDTGSYNSEYVIDTLPIRAHAYHPAGILEPLGLAPEINYILAAEALALIEDRSRTQRGIPPAELNFIAQLLPATSDTALADQMLRTLYAKLDLGSQQSAMATLLHLYDNNIPLLEDGGLALLEFGISLAKDAPQGLLLGLYRRLADAHSAQENLESASRYAETALGIVAGGGSELNPDEARRLRGIVAKSGRRQGDVETRAAQLAQVLKDDLAPVCDGRLNMAAFPWLPLDLLQDDPLLGAIFVAQPAVDTYLTCFDRFTLFLAEKSESYGYMPANRLTDVMYLLAMRNQRDRAMTLYQRVLKPDTWQSSLRPDGAQYSGLSAAIDGLILGGKASWINDPTVLPPMPGSADFGGRVGEALVRLGYSYDAMSFTSQTTAIYNRLSQKGTCETSQVSCEFLVTYEAKYLGRTPEDAEVRDLFTSTLWFPPVDFVYATPVDPAFTRRNGELRLKQHLDSGRLYGAELYARALYGGEGTSAEALLQVPEMVNAGDRINLISVAARTRIAKGQPQAARSLTTQIIAETRTRTKGFAIYGDDPLVRHAARLRPLLETHLETSDFPRAFPVTAIPQAIRDDFFATQLLQATNTAASFAKLSARASEPQQEALRALQDVSVRLVEARTIVTLGTPTQTGGDTLNDLLAERDALVDRLGPELVNSIGLTIPTIEEVSALLEPGEAFLLTYVGQEASYLWLITRNGVEVRRLSASRVEIAALTDAVRSVVDPTDITAPVDLGVLYRAHQLLIGEFDQALQGLGRLIVVPHGPLDSLPWATLLTRPPPTEQLLPEQLREARLNWMIRRYTLAQVPSLAAATFLRTSPFVAGAEARAFFGIGRPDFGNGLTIAPEGSTRSGASYPVRPLPESGLEIDRMAALLGADPVRDVRLDRQATEAAVREADLDSYAILSFATHGVISDEIPGLSEPALLLSAPAGPADPENDGILRASEIAALRLNAELVILSACNTAASQGTAGAEGLSGLSNAFIYAGAHNLIATHWQIPSAAATRMTVGATILKKSGKVSDWSEALQRSALDMIDDTGGPGQAHPRNWGAFVYIGIPGT